MSCLERLIRYCSVDTQSDPKSETIPSTAKQFNLAMLLLKELKELGVEDAIMDDRCYVYAHIPSNIEEDCPAVGFLAHMDTAPDYSGTNVKPQIIENYDGEDIVLKSGRVTKVSQFPKLKTFVGKTLLVTDGNTLLGADDKGGISAIMDAVEYYMKHPEEKHGKISVAFTPDEEIGRGPKHFDVTKMDCDFAYTVDGASVEDYSDETFNADSAVVEFKGFSIHPGEAKDRMINAAALACRYHAMLPEYMTPEHTEGREGFICLSHFDGCMDHAHLEYILRDHDLGKLQKKEAMMVSLVDHFNARYGDGCVELTFKEGYRNMKEVINNVPYVSEIAIESIKAIGYEPNILAVRGGTDGSQISFMGIPCPNLGAGGGNFHGPNEYCVVEELEDASRLIREIVRRTMEVKA